MYSTPTTWWYVGYILIIGNDSAERITLPQCAQHRHDAAPIIQHVSARGHLRNSSFQHGPQRSTAAGRLAVLLSSLFASLSFIADFVPSNRSHSLIMWRETWLRPIRLDSNPNDWIFQGHPIDGLSRQSKISWHDEKALGCWQKSQNVVVFFPLPDLVSFSEKISNGDYCDNDSD